MSPLPQVNTTKQNPEKEGEWAGLWRGWGAGLRARSLLVNQSWFPRWSCSRFDFSSCPPPPLLPSPPAPWFQFLPEKQWGLLSNQPSSSNSQQQLKLQERERGGGEAAQPGGKGANFGRSERDKGESRDKEKEKKEQVRRWGAARNGSVCFAGAGGEP